MFNNNSGTTKNEFSIGTEVNKISFRTNNGIPEYKGYSDVDYISFSSKLPSAGGTMTGALTNNNVNNMFSRSKQLDVLNQISTAVGGSSYIKRALFFDETGATTTLKDRSANLANATLSANASTLSPSISGDCRFLNMGATNTFDFADANDLSFGNGTTDSPFSIVSLINPNSVSGNLAILCKEDATSGSIQRGYQFYFSGGSLALLLTSQNITANYLMRYHNATLSADIGTNHVYSALYGGTSVITDMEIHRDGVRIDDSSATSGTYVAMSNTTSKLGNYVLNSSGVKVSQGNYKGGAIFLFNIKLSAAQSKAISNILLCYTGQDNAFL